MQYYKLLCEKKSIEKTKKTSLVLFLVRFQLVRFSVSAVFFSFLDIPPINAGKISQHKMCDSFLSQQDRIEYLKMKFDKKAEKKKILKDFNEAFQELEFFEWNYTYQYRHQ